MKAADIDWGILRGALIFLGAFRHSLWPATKGEIIPPGDDA